MRSSLFTVGRTLTAIFHFSFSYTSLYQPVSIGTAPANPYGCKTNFTSVDSSSLFSAYTAKPESVQVSISPGALPTLCKPNKDTVVNGVLKKSGWSSGSFFGKTTSDSIVIGMYVRSGEVAPSI